MASVLHRVGGGIKSVGNGLIEGYLVSYGSPTDTDLQHEFFTKATDFCLSWFNERPVLYHHGMDSAVKLHPIGYVKTIKQDDVGLWAQAQLDMANEYARTVYDLVKTGKFGWSSGSVDHLVKIEPTGEIKTWPLLEGSVTPSPAQPEKTSIRALKAYLRSNSAFARFADELDARLGGGTSTFVKGDSSMFGSKYNKGRGFRAEDDPALMSDEELAAMADEDFAAMTDDPALLSDDPTFMSDDLAFMSDDPALLADDEFATMSDDFPVMGEDDFATLADDEFATMSDDFPVMGDDFPVMGDDYAAMADDVPIMGDPLDPAIMSEEDLATMSDEEVAAMARRSVRNRAKMAKTKAAQMQANQIAALQQRIKTLERMEAPGQRSFGLSAGRAMKANIRVTRDSADQPGRYTKAFINYMRRGLSALYDDDKRVLFGKGVDRSFGAADSQYDAATGTYKALNTSSDTSLGFAVPEEWVSELNKNIAAETVMAPECKVRNTTSDRILQPNLTTTDARRAYAANVTWPGESPGSGTEHRATEMALSQIAIPIHVMLISMTSTMTALEDVGFDLQAEINEQFSEGVGVAYDTLIWNGNGNGKMAGIVTDTRVTGTASAGIQTVGGYIPSGKAGDFASADPIIKMTYHMPAQYRRRCKWIANSNTIGKIAELKDGQGRYLFADANGNLLSGMPTEMRGFPILFNEFADDIAANSFPLILADLSRAYVIGKRVEFSVRRFDEVLADQDQVLFIGRARLGGQVIQPAAIKALKMAAS